MFEDIEEKDDLDRNRDVHGIMVDVETLGLEADAVILQIGAVSFDANYLLLSEFSEYISIADSLLRGMTTTPGTLAFWRHTLDEDRSWTPSQTNKMFTSTQSVSTVAEKFQLWLDKVYPRPAIDGYTIWCQGLLFDIPKIDNFMCVGGFERLTDQINYWRFRDLRGHLSQLRQYDPDSMDKVEKAAYNLQLIQHDALQDCKYQLRMLQGAHELLDKAFTGARS